MSSEVNRDRAIGSVLDNVSINTQTENESEIEVFQNSVLRPILKFQNNAIIGLFKDYALTRKFDLGYVDDKKLEEFIRKSLLSDQKLKSLYIGLVSSLFKDSDFEFYFANKKEVHKRITSMLITRIFDNLSL